MCGSSLRSRSRWAAVGRWRELWTLLRLSSAHTWWSLWWGSDVVSFPPAAYFTLFLFFFFLTKSLKSVKWFLSCHFPFAPPPLECILVQSGLVHHLLHPRDHLLYQTSQVLQENEVLWCLWVRGTNKKTHFCMLCKNHMTGSFDRAGLSLTAVNIFVSSDHIIMNHIPRAQMKFTWEDGTCAIHL